MNGYFQLISTETGTGIKVFAPTDGGLGVPLPEIREYLEKRAIAYDLVALNTAVEQANGNVSMLSTTPLQNPERESYRMEISVDEMKVSAFFYPPSDGTQKGGEMNTAEVMGDLSHNRITYGIQEEAIDAYFANRVYCTEIVLALGKPVREGTDAHIEYLFKTDTNAKPQMNEDGTVDFKNLNLITHCEEGQELAKLTPEDAGDDGWNVYGKPVMPQKVKHLDLKGNKNTKLSEDKLTLYAGVNGHVALLASGEVAVSNVFTVESVDNSTGNIEYDGSVVVNGNVESGFMVKANGDIEVKGSVGGAILRAKGNVVLTRGMNGMTKGEIHAKGNVVTKFLEGATVKAGGNVSAESIMRSKVQAGKEVFVDGKKGFIAGGHVAARERVTAKTLGSEMGADTLIEVGADPSLKENVKKMQEQVKDAEKKKEAIAQPLANFVRILKSGGQLKPDQLKYMQQLNMQNKVFDQVITKNNAAIEAAQAEMQAGKTAEVIVTDNAFPGTTIGIGELSRTLKTPAKYSRFVIDEGEIRIAPI